MSGKTLISICIPVYNEEENVARVVPAVDEALKPLAGRYEVEFVFTDNHSSDGTFDLLAELAREDRRVRVIRFSRNFGYQKSVLTGYLNARGACAVQLDADLQDPPALIPDLVREWEKGAKVVYGVRRTRKEGRMMTALRQAFYRIINLLSEHPIPVDSGDFRLIDRCIIEALREAPTSHPYLRGQIAGLGFRQVGIPYRRDERRYGRSKFPLRAMLALAVDGIVSQSIVPLRISTYLGLLMAVVTVLAIIGYTGARLFFAVDWPPGFTTLTVLLLLSISLNGLFLGIIGEYLARIYHQVSKRHSVIEERRLGFEEKMSRADRAAAATEARVGGTSKTASRTRSGATG